MVFADEGDEEGAAERRERGVWYGPPPTEESEREGSRSRCDAVEVDDRSKDVRGLAAEAEAEAEDEWECECEWCA